MLMFTLCSALWQTVNRINNIQEIEAFKSAGQPNAKQLTVSIAHEFKL